MHASTSLLLVSLLSIPLNVLGGTQVRASAQSISSATLQQSPVFAVNTTNTPEDCTSRGCGRRHDKGRGNCTSRGCGRRHDKGRGSGRIDSKLSATVPSFSNAPALSIHDAITVRRSGRIDVDFS